MRSVVSRGKDVTEAMNIGIELLRTSKKEVHIEVLQTPKEGFFGIGVKIGLKFPENAGLKFPTFIDLCIRVV